MMESEGFDSRVLPQAGKESSAVADFARAFVNSAVETPVNGALQALNKATGAALPDLHICAAPEHSSRAADEGLTAGALVDLVVLSKFSRAAMGELGGTGMGGQALRAGVVGGIFTGLLEPSDPDSKTFLKDRLENFGVGAITLGVVGASAHALNLTEFLSANTLANRVALGAFAGLNGGLAYAESNAILKQHQAFPELNETLRDARDFAGLGAFLGAASSARALTNERFIKPSAF